jgi:hypothetical protein
LPKAAEGVTLSGVRKDEDLMSTELWRHPLNWGPKVQARQRQTLRQKDKDFLSGFYAFLTDRAVCTIRFQFKKEDLWKRL